MYPLDLPILDLNSPHSLLLPQLRTACLSHGFFYIQNHNLDSSLLSQTFFQSQQFFSLPLSTKLQSLITPKRRGFDPCTRDHLISRGLDLSSISASQLVWKESFFIGREVSEGSPEGADAYQGLNVFPGADLLPDFRGVMMRYFMVMWELGLRE